LQDLARVLQAAAGDHPSVLIHNPSNAIPCHQLVLDEAVWTGLLELIRVLLLSKQQCKVLDPIASLHARPAACNDEQKTTQCVVPSLTADLLALSQNQLPPTYCELARLNRVYRLFAALFYNKPNMMQVFAAISAPVLATLGNARQMNAAASSAACTCVSNFAFGSREAQVYLKSLGIFSRIRTCIQEMERLSAKTLLRLLEAFLNAGFLLSEPFSGNDVKRLVLRKRRKSCSNWGKLQQHCCKLDEELEWEDLFPVYVTSCFSPLARLEIERNAVEEEDEDSRVLWPMALHGARGDALAAFCFQTATLHENFLSKWILQYWLGDDRSMEGHAIEIDQVCMAGLSPRYAVFCFQKEPHAPTENMLTLVYGKLLAALKNYNQNPRPNPRMSFILRKRFVAWMERQKGTISEDMVEEWFEQYLDDMFSVAHSYRASETHEILQNVASDHIPRDVPFGPTHSNFARVVAIPAEIEADIIETIADTLVKSGFVPEGKLWFHSCYGHKALKILEAYSLAPFGPSSRTTLVGNPFMSMKI